MHAVDLLKQQHREVDRLFGRIARTQGRDKDATFGDLADALAIHWTVEERIFYPSARTEDTEDILDDAVQEHLEAKRILADMLEIDPSEPEFDVRCQALRDEVEHHVTEEEMELFPVVMEALEPDELGEVGEEMETLEEDLRSEGEPRQHVPEEVGSALQV